LSLKENERYPVGGFLYMITQQALPDIYQEVN
jgi:hypothetical protein